MPICHLKKERLHSRSERQLCKLKKRIFGQDEVVFCSDEGLIPGTAAFKSIMTANLNLLCQTTRDTEEELE